MRWAHRGFQDAVKALRMKNARGGDQRIATPCTTRLGNCSSLCTRSGRSAPELPSSASAGRRIKELLNQVEKTCGGIHELRPTILDDLGWIPAIRFLARGSSALVCRSTLMHVSETPA